ncbi:MAG: 2-oxoacid:acceptor oxidoreductase subunit alpha [Armatimonadota bacterium]|nr:2-oxoacid:acceptor oxidoreductase subunit alpha [Armatimonadota bacterium]
MSKRVLTGRHFMMGDVACAEGALAAGCTFFAGYPITPSTEIAERLARRLPEVGGHYIQMEDELASMAAIIGASWAGAKAMTATSGPGFSLMMENIGLAVMMETPCVVVDIQRGSPSTGLPTLTGQSDVMQAKWGSHGDYEIIAYAPASCQEMFDLTIRAFNMAERFRNPVLIMADEVVGHMTERVVIPPEEAIERWERPRPMVPPGEHFLPFAAGEDLVPPMPRAGEGYRIYVESLTHDERGYPVMSPEVHDRLVRRLNEKIRRAYDQIIDYELSEVEDAEIIVISYGSTARSARQAARIARKEGMRVGTLRLITLWPFPGRVVEELSARIRAFVVAELNLGQMAREVERFTDRPVFRANHAGGMMMPPELILASIEEAYRDAKGSRRQYASIR